MAYSTEPITLSELSEKIRNAIVGVFPFSVPVVAEISEMNVNANGHCYLELVEHSRGQIIARIRGIIYANRFPLLQSYFSSVTGSEIQVGLQVLVMVRVSYHSLYGLSVEVNDIDPKYTLGDLEQQKQLIINRLIETGIHDMNKSLPLPKIIKNIAVISSPTAAGYGDFVNHIENNPYGFVFNVNLFEAYMQGTQAVKSIQNAIHAVFDSETRYDVLVIIRGGGSKAELAVFDDFDLAYLITQLPIPVLTGIGHERDNSVADFVANQGLKTPTAVADFIVDLNLEASSELNDLQLRLKNSVNSLFNIENQRLTNLENLIKNSAYLYQTTNRELLLKLDKKVSKVAQNFSHRQQVALNDMENRIKYSFKTFCSQQNSLTLYFEQKLKDSVKTNINNLRQKLNIAEQKLTAINPQTILNLGYAIVSKDGKRITDSEQASVNDNIKIHLSKGSLDAQVTSSMSNEQ
ncbi:MAG TPA: exodeoxyribonuclease VII large subunit [Salinivirgaceae bacterium]|nr:exodeoxyribonuclease VII large subunit [Salinivirgaceae bacterium]HQA75644.1 exodeoxyribonuclease VII large subunit [Salinivirgaceae bacterium]